MPRVKTLTAFALAAAAFFSSVACSKNDHVESLALTLPGASTPVQLEEKFLALDTDIHLVDFVGKAVQVEFHGGSLFCSKDSPKQKSNTARKQKFAVAIDGTHDNKRGGVFAYAAKDLMTAGAFAIDENSRLKIDPVQYEFYDGVNQVIIADTRTGEIKTGRAEDYNSKSSVAGNLLLLCEQRQQRKGSPTRSFKFSVPDRKEMAFRLD